MMRVVVIDDEDMVAEACAMMLRTSGFEVFTAHDSESGLALIRELIPSVVVSDIRMPGITGDELASMLKRDPATQHIPVLLMSAHGSPAGIQCDGFLSKPFLRHDLIEVVKKLASKEERKEPTSAG
jgi:CheY-like chemotaxis protein